MKERPKILSKSTVWALLVVICVGYLCHVSRVNESFHSSPLTISRDDREACKENFLSEDVPRNLTLSSNKWISCFPGETSGCVARNLTFNLYSATNAGHFMLDDALNIIIFRPEKLCNVRYEKMLEGMFDYTPTISSAPCEEDFPYFGYYQTQRLHFQVKNRVRFVKFIEPQIQSLFGYVSEKMTAKCPVSQDNDSDEILFIRRKESYGRAFDERYIPSGVKSVYFDNSQQSLLDILCEVARSSLVIVPHGSEMVFPIVLKKQFIVLTNDWKSDTFYYEAIASGSTTHAFLHMDSTPWIKKPNHPYYNNFSPTSSQLDQLLNLLKSYKNKTGFTTFDFQVKGTNDKQGILGEIISARRMYLESQGKS